MQVNRYVDGVKEKKRCERKNTNAVVMGLLNKLTELVESVESTLAVAAGEGEGEKVNGKKKVNVNVNLNDITKKKKKVKKIQELDGGMQTHLMSCLHSLAHFVYRDYEALQCLVSFGFSERDAETGEVVIYSGVQWFFQLLKKVLGWVAAGMRPAALEATALDAAATAEKSRDAKDAADEKEKEKDVKAPHEVILESFASLQQSQSSTGTGTSTQKAPEYLSPAVLILNMLLKKADKLADVCGKLVTFDLNTEVLIIHDVNITPESFVSFFDGQDVYHPNLAKQIRWRGIPGLWANLSANLDGYYEGVEIRVDERGGGATTGRDSGDVDADVDMGGVSPGRN